jgi:putative nucleotidyltransferase with HDIG domain
VPIAPPGGCNRRAPQRSGGAAPAGGLRPAPVRRRERPASRAALGPVQKFITRADSSSTSTGVAGLRWRRRLGTLYAQRVPSLVDQARTLAEACLAAELPRRWVHVRAVAAKAEGIALVLADNDRPVLVSAAWLHDIGYASGIASTGFHPLDGARFLRQQGFDDRVTELVAHHSCAVVEAEEREMYGELAAEFHREYSPTADALWYCDMTTGPDGQDFDVLERLDEIRNRYGPDHVVTRFINRAELDIVDAVRRTEERLNALTQSHPM